MNVNLNINLERILLAVLAVAVVILSLKVFEYRIALEHVVSAAIILGAAWLVYDAFAIYKGSPGNWTVRLRAAFRWSATIVATRVQYFVGLVMVYSEWIANVVGEPNVAASLQQYASPKVSGSLLIGSSVVIAVCRQRRGSTDPVTPNPPSAPAPVAPVTAPVTPIAS